MELDHPEFHVFRSTSAPRDNWSGTSVRKIVRFLNNEKMDPYVGHTRGLNKVNSEKSFIILNSSRFNFNKNIEHNFRGRVSFLYTYLTSHYLNQDPVFIKWADSNKDAVIFEPRMI